MNLETEKALLVWLRAQKKLSQHYGAISAWLGVVQGILLVLQAYWIATSLDEIIIEQSQQNLNSHLIWIAGLIMLRAITGYCRETASFIAGQKVRQQLRLSVLDKLQQLGPIFAKSKPAGHWNSMLLEQVEQVQDFYSRYLPQQTLIAFTPLIILMVVFPQSWVAGLILLVTAPLIPLFMILVGRNAAKAGRAHTVALQRLTSYFADRLAGLSTLKLYYRYQAEEKAVAQASDDYRKRTMSVLKLAFLSSAVLEFFSAVSIAVLAVYLGFSFLEYLETGFYGVKVTLFSAMFILILAPEFYQPLRDLGSFYHAKGNAVAASESIVELLNMDVSQQGEKANNPFNSNEKITIKAKNWLVQSHDGKTLLGPINFTWQSGERIAIVGESGSGKSSLLYGLLGFLPYQGSLQINDIELSQMSSMQWYSQLSWVGQTPELLFGTLIDNLLLADTEMTDDDMWELLDKIGLKEFVQAHPKQLQLEISEQNTGLSIGQAQRIVLARAIAKKTQLLVADEPTAALDKCSKAIVWQTLMEQVKSTGCFIVSHELDKLEQMDGVWVVEHGEIIEKGTYEELSAVNGAFKALLSAQVAHFSLSGASLKEQAVEGKAND
ncbi:cysteine/glutathione ABC transporter permease/ATP-binding protein CydD [Parashewanella spongiae]|uniref:Cysteine/glutathione ABC transporter permease/ATP-binding protein CydD n=1 Tax=Parashewanella spongiae TaxID=342950 RepID=A0A3A6TZL6_9GAMM|nr:cysteine/glutathione ABC transporter permease/ATP-binding protein CydD [Parashewanella spongiae]MCL1078376.1 cysteine/glutathione ABC transporter permease/ATP-binding protein CydD [Parashewanella spongiae]RJY07089.1 cysteine/glutathione ABC transporter permease/ATP-binding protein CydD [Parashewanella spongiae]